MNKKFLNKIFLFPLIGLALTGCGNNDTPSSSEQTSTHTHVFNQEIVSDNYKVSEATIYDEGVYYKSCSCGEHSEETFTTDKLTYSLLGEESIKTPAELAQIVGNPMVAFLVKNQGMVFHRQSFLYESKNLSGERMVLSGAITIPFLNNEPYYSAFVIDNHPTFLDDNLSPSNTWTQYCITCIRGGIVFEFDLVGYGSTSDLVRDYHCQHLVGRNTVDGVLRGFDLLKDVYDISRDNEPIINEGYSQGGYDALALLKYLETEATDEEKNALPIYCTYAGAGAYNLEIMFTESLKKETFIWPEYLVLAIETMYAYHPETFGALTPNDFLTEYGREIRQALEYKSLDKIEEVKAKTDGNGNLLCEKPQNVFIPELFETENQYLQIMHNASEQENLLDGNWIPSGEVNLFWSEDDDLVSPKCSEKAVEIFGAVKSANATSTDLITYDTVASIGHIDGGTSFYINLVTKLINVL